MNSLELDVMPFIMPRHQYSGLHFLLLGVASFSNSSRDGRYNNVYGWIFLDDNRVVSNTDIPTIQ